VNDAIDRLSSRPRCRRFIVALLAASFLIPALPAAAAPLDKAVLYLSWRAEPDSGGFFQALMSGIYRKYGLDVQIQLGNPQANAQMLLSLHKVDFIQGNSGTAIHFVEQNLPLVTVAAMFQKDPRVLIAHPGQGSDTLEEMKGKPILIGSQGFTTFWPFLKAKYGFSDDQIKASSFSIAPFLANPKAIQEGFVTEEPYMMMQQGEPHPVVILLSDHGYQQYTTTLVTTADSVQTRPDYVKRFVNASIEGWYSYLNGDPTPGNTFIKQNNPDMTDGQIAYAIKEIKDQGLVDSGDAKTLGIGAMTDARWQSFYQAQVEAGAIPAGIDYKKAYTLQFIDQKVGL
jgi:NitT/TauT family transport system substrate-binding protein